MPGVDEQSRKMFIGGLSLETDENGLRSFYEQFGPLIDVVVMVDNNSGRSRGFGFVTFGEAGCVERALASKPHVIDGKQVDAKPAVPKQDTQEMEDYQRGEQMRKLFIGGLTADSTEEQLRKHFSQYGEIVDCVVMRDSNTHRSRGFGFVTYATDAGVDEAQRGRPHTINNKEVETKRAVPRDNNTAEAHVTVKKLFVGGIKDTTTEEAVRGYFDKFGTIEKVEFIHDRSSQKRKGFCFVIYDDYDAVDKATLCGKHQLDGKAVEVKKALSKQEIANMKPGDSYGGGRGRSGGRGGLSSRYGDATAYGGFTGGYGGGSGSRYDDTQYGGFSGGYGGGIPDLRSGYGDFDTRSGGPSSFNYGAGGYGAPAGPYGPGPTRSGAGAGYGGYSAFSGQTSAAYGSGGGGGGGFGQNYGASYGGGPMRGRGDFRGARSSAPYGRGRGGRF